MNDNISFPNVLWIAIISLALFGILHFIIGLTNPPQFISFGVNIILIIGLLRLKKWAYFLSIIASLIAPFILSFEEPIYFYVVLLLNLTVLIPVLISTKSLFSISVNHSVPGKSAVK